jgi:hypothetical protein
MDLDSIPLLKARWFQVANRKKIDWITIHDMEAPETATTAENTARMFATTSRKASCHYNVDCNSVVRSVLDKDIAYHAPPNTPSIGIEHAGFASQRLDQWLDDYSRAELIISAELTAALCAKWNVPRQFVNAEGLKAGARGITTHWEVSKAFHQTDHTDPGPNFPMAQYLEWVNTTTPPIHVVQLPPQGGHVESAFPVVDIVAHTSWNGGYIEIAEDGGVFPAEGAPFFGSMGGQLLNKPIVGGAATPTGQGYWLVGSDGGIYSFGDAQFKGSTGNLLLAQPIVGMEAFSVQGYWLVARDGGVFAFGDAPFRGSV